jgi:hypothetical protein
MKLANPLLRLLAAFAIVVALSAIPIAQVAACSCMAMTPGEAAAMAEVVFAGTAVSEERGPADPDAALYTFQVDGVAKGDVGSRVTVAAGGDSAMCGMSFGLNERWLVFATTQDGALTTSLCAGNLPLQPDEEPPIAVYAPTAGDPGDAPGTGVPIGVVLPVAAVVALAGVSALLFWRADRPS